MILGPASDIEIDLLDLIKVISFLDSINIWRIEVVNKDMNVDMNEDVEAVR